jgi:hypothetical protein
MRDAVALDDLQPALTAALEELVAQPGLAKPGIRNHADDLSRALVRAGERSVEYRQLLLAAHEARQPAFAHRLHPRASRPHARQLEHSHGLIGAPDLKAAELEQLKIPLDQHRGRRGHVDLPRLGELLDARRQSYGVADRGVVDIQVFPPAADDDLTRS